ncbi:MAG: hypothetical protein AAGB00_12225, partial [Planctomycetota bacterium]
MAWLVVTLAGFVGAGSLLRTGGVALGQQATPVGQPTGARSGETPAGPPAKPAPAALPPAAGPDTTIWVDEQGVPRPMVGMTYAEVLRAWRLLQGLEESDPQPRYTRAVFDAAGAVLGDRVELAVRHDVILHTDDWVAVPLGTAGGIPTVPPTIDGNDSGPQSIDYDEQRGGFIARLKGIPGDRRRVELRILLPLQRDASQAVLQTNIARATTAELRLTSGDRFAEPFASSGVLLDEERDGDGKNLLVARGMSGDVQIGWRAPVARRTRPRPSALRVDGQIVSDIDGRVVRSRATLRVAVGFGGEIERFRVRLPEGARLVGANPTEGDAEEPRVTLVPTQDAAAGSPSKPVCLVTLPRPTAKPVEVTIETEQPVGGDGQTGVDLAGFDVVGALRQEGVVALRVADDWRLRWRVVEGAQRIDVASLDEDLRLPGVTAAAKVYGQPWKLDVRVIRLGNRIEAVPTYRLEIAPDAAVLTTRVNYRIPGARVTSFTVDLRDWARRLTPLPPVGPSELVDTNRVTENEDGELYVPLLRPTSQQASIEFTARRDLAPVDETLDFRLPVARASTQGASELIVVVDPAVQLAVDSNRTRRLRAAPLPADKRDPADPAGLRTYRFVGFLPDQRFVAEKRLRPGEVDVAIATDVTLNATTTRVSQTLDYRARYKPVNRVRLAAPAEVIDAEDFRLELVPAPGEAAGDAGAEAVPLGYASADA